MMQNREYDNFMLHKHNFKMETNRIDTTLLFVPSETLFNPKVYDKSTISGVHRKVNRQQERNRW